MSGILTSITNSWNDLRYYNDDTARSEVNPVDDVLQHFITVKDLRTLIYQYIGEIGEKDIALEICRIFEREGWVYPLTSPKNQRFVQRHISQITWFQTPPIQESEKSILPRMSAVIRQMTALRHIIFELNVDDTKKLKEFYGTVLHQSSSVEAVSFPCATVEELDYVATYRPKLTELYVDSYRGNPSELAIEDQLKRFPSLKKLQMISVGNIIYHTICTQCSELNALSISYSWLEGGRLNKLHHLPHLTVLDVSSMRLTKRDLTAISQLKLTALRMQGYRRLESDSGMSKVPLPKLQVEDGRFVDIDNEGVGAIIPAICLSMLEINATIITSLMSSNLIALDLSYNILCESGIKALGGFQKTQLKQLLIGAPFYYNGDTPVHVLVAALYKIDSLEELDVTGYPLIHHEFIKLTSMPNMQTLRCGGWKTVIKMDTFNAEDAEHAELRKVVIAISNFKRRLKLTFSPYTVIATASHPYREKKYSF